MGGAWHTRPMLRLHRSTFALLFALFACGSSNGSAGPPLDGSDTDGGLVGDASAADAAGTVRSDAASGGAGDSSGPRDGSTDGSVVGDGGRIGFHHPGVLVGREQLDFVKAKLATGAAPWKSALDAANKSRWGAAAYSATPRAVVECGSYSNPDYGCTDEKNDAMAAYTHALLYYYGGDVTHADKAIEIMNAWSAVLTDHTNSNAPLQSAWVASVWPRAAEIVRYSYTGWAPADVTRFGAMLRDVYLPKVVNGSKSNGNWELSMIEAVLAIAVFLDDRATFEHGVEMWRARVPAYVYLSSDGPLPVAPPAGNAKTQQELIAFWYAQATFMDGLCQETCRDLGHVQYGLAAMINAAETARLQGVDLYSEQAARITKTMEFHADFLNGAAVPSTLCGGKLSAATADPMWDIALNEYGRRLQKALPKTEALVAKIRPTGADHHMVWETLTHAETGGPTIP